LRLRDAVRPRARYSDALRDRAVDKGVIAVRPTLQTEIKFFGRHSVLKDPIAIYLNDATLAAAFVARWCVGYKVESADGVFQIREDAPTPWSVLGAHKTP
jgi:hypothetical protein